MKIWFGIHKEQLDTVMKVLKETSETAKKKGEKFDYKISDNKYKLSDMEGNVYDCILLMQDNDENRLLKRGVWIKSKVSEILEIQGIQSDFFFRVKN